MEGALGRGHVALNENQQTRFEPAIEILGLQSGSLEVAHAAQAPEMLGKFVDQDVLGRVGGLMLGAQAGAEFLELGGIFVGKYKRLGVEAVLKGVVTGAGLAGGSTGAGTTLGVGAIDFGAGRFHTSVPLETKMGSRNRMACREPA